MQISTEIDFDLDIDDHVREIAEEVMECNACDYADKDDVQCLIDDADFCDPDAVQELIDESAQDVSDLVDLTNDHQIWIDEHNGIIEGMRGDLAILMHQLEMHEIGHRNRSFKGRLRRTKAAVLGFISKVHWYSPFIGPRR